MSTKYIPTNHIAFCAWAKVMIAYELAYHEKWGVEVLDLNLSKLVDKLEILAILCNTSKRTAEDVVERNMLRKEILRKNPCGVCTVPQ